MHGRGFIHDPRRPRVEFAVAVYDYSNPTRSTVNDNITFRHQLFFTDIPWLDARCDAGLVRWRVVYAMADSGTSAPAELALALFTRHADAEAARVRAGGGGEVTPFGR